MRVQDDVIRVGIPWVKLRAHAPRGIVRVARAVAERLVANPKFELHAISDPVFESNEILFEAVPLAEWLDRHPMRIPTPPVPAPIPQATPLSLPPARIPPLARIQRACAVVLSELGLRRLLLPAWKRRFWVKRAIRKACRLLGLTRPARSVWHALRGKPASPLSVPSPLPAPASEPLPPAAVEVPPPPNEYVSIRDLDVIVSFECFDEIWEWPVELFPTKLIGLYYDAIPFRIDEGENWNPGRYMRALGRMVARSHSIGCISQSALNDLASFFPSTRGRSWLWYLAADEERFLHTGDYPTTPHPIAQRPGRKIAMIGEIEPRKNQAGVLRACRLLSASYPGERLTLVLIGRKIERNPCQTLADEVGQFVDVVHTDYVPDDQIGNLLRACDVFVYPSLWEGFGIPILEAMIAGVPVVCADLSSLPEVAGEYAFYCDPYDPESIASAIRSALDLDTEAREALVRDARAWVSRFDWDRTTEMLAEAIIRVVDKAAEPIRRAG